MKIGSAAHKELFCRSLMNSYLDYEPERLPWPELDAAESQRLQSIPFWEEALNTELKAGNTIQAYLPSVTDPLIREAIALQGEEESRHGRLFKHLTDRYNVQLSGQPPNRTVELGESGFVEFGYGECLDAFLGFGLFKIARQSKFLPDALMDIFDILLQEEARHIVFFVNWIAYLQVERGRGMRPLRAATSLWNYGKAAKNMMSLVNSSAESNRSDFAATEAAVFMDDFSIQRLISECLSENARRMAKFEPELLQPELMPSLAKIALSTLQLLPKSNAPQSENLAS
ncbi:MAG TPA: ferritin-like domain-containing protein [Coleofasciculaceae cyanobacterium]